MNLKLEVFFICERVNHFQIMSLTTYVSLSYISQMRVSRENWVVI